MGMKTPCLDAHSGPLNKNLVARTLHVKRLCRGPRITKILAKFVKFVFCNPCKSFSVLAVLSSFWFLLPFWCHSAFANYYFGTSFNLKVIKNRTLFLKFRTF